MPFGLKQRMYHAPISVGLQRTPCVDAATGVVTYRKVTTHEPLPDKELFDPAACVAAGVNLELVNSRPFSLNKDYLGGPNSGWENENVEKSVKNSENINLDNNDNH